MPKYKSPDGRVFDSLIKAVENYCNGKCADCKLCAFCTYPMEDWIANVERDYTYKICKIMGYEVIADKKACENCMFFEGDNTCNISGGKMRIAPVKICSMWEPKDELQQNCESIANDSNHEAKSDGGKPRPSLVPPALIRGVDAIREFGCKNILIRTTGGADERDLLPKAADRNHERRQGQRCLHCSGTGGRY